MKRTGHERATPEKQLGILAMRFRGTRIEAERQQVADDYARTVTKLIKRKKGWDEIPSLEDQLPDEWMPEEFFEHWKLTPPNHRAGRAG
jgi:hypothetical protein